MSNRNGRAASQNSGNTGAPGDETIAGAPRTCVNCHGSSAITASLQLTLLNAAGQPVTTYTPGQMYTARLTITASGTGLSGYGFQMIALRNANNGDTDGFSDPSNTNNFKIATISNGRTYAEHAGISNSNVFEVLWQAPVAGTGSVTFYASGNGVNRNNGSSGDGAADAQLKVTETGTSSVKSPDVPVFLRMAFSPNPLREKGILLIETAQAAPCQVAITDLQGRTVATSVSSSQQIHTFEWDAADWVPGLYWVRVSSGGHAKTLHLLKI